MPKRSEPTKRTLSNVRSGPIITKWPIPWLHSCRRYYLSNKFKVVSLRGAIICPVKPLDRNGRKWRVRIMCDYDGYPANTEITVRLTSITKPKTTEAS